MNMHSYDEMHEQRELLGRLCDEDLDNSGRQRLGELLAEDVEAQQLYVRYLDLQSALRMHAQSLDDQDFAVLEAQRALDATPQSALEEAIAEHGPATAGKGQGRDAASGATIPFLSRLGALALRPARWTAAAAMLLVGVTIISFEYAINPTAPPPTPTDRTVVVPVPLQGTAQLRGTVGALWAGARMEMPEGEVFIEGQRLELVEGLAEVMFSGGAKLVLQGPAILQIRDGSSAAVSVGRIAVSVPDSDSRFVVQTPVAELASLQSEFGAEIDVDGSLVTRVYEGSADLQVRRGAATANSLSLASGQGARVEARTGKTALLEEPNGLNFVRYLPKRETLINLAEVVAGRDSTSKAYHRGVSLVDGRAIDDYGAPAIGDGHYYPTTGIDFVDGVFIPNGRLGATQIDSTGQSFASFPPTSGDCWGGAIMARRPRKEDSLPLIRLEFHGDTYGYVNWLHIASKADELSPQGHGLIGMHSNSGITFDLHAIRARYPDKKVMRFRAVIGNLESKAETAEQHTAEAWVLVDGKLRHHRPGFSRENGAESIDVPLADHDRFLVLAVTDDGGGTAYDWVAFGDAVVEMTNVESITADEEVIRPRHDAGAGEDEVGKLPRVLGTFGASDVAGTDGVAYLAMSQVN
jgi:hypothetical protein